MKRVLFFVTILSSAAYANEPNVDLNSLLDAIEASLVGGDKIIAASGIVLLLVHLFRKFALPRLKLGNGVIPYVSIASGLLMGVAADMFAGVSAMEAAKIALLSGPGASLMWDSFFKLMAKKNQ